MPYSDLLDQKITVENFGDWSKMYVQDVTDRLQSRFDQAVATETNSIQDAANKKVINANQDAQLAYDALSETNRKFKMFLIGASIFLLVIFFYKE